MRVRRILRIIAALLAIIIANGEGPLAQDVWPSKPIKIIAPVAPGGGVDLMPCAAAAMARIVAIAPAEVSPVQIRSACGVVPAVPVGQQRVGLFRSPAAALIGVCGNDVVEHRIDDLPGGLHGVLAGER